MSEMRLKIKLQVGEGEKLESQEFGLIPWRDLKIEFLQFSKKERNNDNNKTLQSIYIYIYICSHSKGNAFNFPSPSFFN